MSKYHAKKQRIGNLVFDSKKEAMRWLELEKMQRDGLISNLRQQVKFELLPNQRGANGKVIERAVHYIADFVYTKDGETVVEDVKGYRRGRAYDVFVLKRKLMLQKGYRVREV